MLSELTVRDLLDRFASSDPTPGGGSAAALAGALGASLLAMVAGMAKTRNNTPEERTSLDDARAEILRHRETLMQLIDRDAQAYDLVVSAYRRPKNTDEEKTARLAAIQEAMHVAAETPLETIRVCAEAVTAARPVQASGNPSAVSDIAMGIVLLGSSMQGGMFNVAVNLDGIKDESRRRSLAERTLSLMQSIHQRAGGEPHAGPITDLMQSLMKHAGRPDSPARQHQAAALAAEALRLLGSSDAREALEVLARGSDATVAASAREALDRWKER